MIIKLQDQEKLNTVSPCLVQLYEGFLFTQGVVGTTDNELVIYNDNEPDSCENEVAYYLIKRKIDITDIRRFEYGRVKNNRQLKYYRYIKIDFVDESHPFWIYYTSFDKKDVRKLFKFLRNKGLPSKHKNLDIAPVF